MKSIRKIYVSLILTGLLMNACSTPVKIWEWRGEDRNGIYPDVELLKAWPEEGPALAWEYEGVGNGYGSPVFTDDGMYIMGELDSLAWLFYFDPAGTLLWKKDFGPEWVKNWNGSRCAPTIVDNLVYVVSGMGNLYCFDRHSGEVQWKVDMVEDLHGEYPLFGYSEAPAIDGDLIFCVPGGSDTNVVALNRMTGELVWKNAGVGERPGYNQPRVIELESRNVFVTFSAYHMLGFDTQTGELLWTHVQDNTLPEDRKPGVGDTHANTVLWQDGFIYYAEGDGNCGVKLKLSADGGSIEEVWRNKDFDSYMGGIVMLGDYMYGCGTAARDLKSIHIETGEIGCILDAGTGSLIAADGMLYYYNWRGEVMLITADPVNMEIKGKFRMTKGTKEHFCHPVIHEGKLYVRHGNVIQAYQIKA